MADRGTPPLAMERVGSLRNLGLTVASDLSVSAHVGALINARGRSIYALRLLRAHRLPDHACAKDRYKGSNHQPHPKCGSCMVGLCIRFRQGTNPTIS